MNEELELGRGRRTDEAQTPSVIKKLRLLAESSHRNSAV